MAHLGQIDEDAQAVDLRDHLAVEAGKSRSDALQATLADQIGFSI